MKDDLKFSGYRLRTDSGRLLVERELIDTTKPGDYGADPLGGGLFRMVPSGDVVDAEERGKRLGKH